MENLKFFLALLLFGILGAVGVLVVVGGSVHASKNGDIQTAIFYTFTGIVSVCFSVWAFKRTLTKMTEI